MTEPDFNECFLEFLNSTNQTQVTAEFFTDNIDSLGLREAERILSIGPGKTLWGWDDLQHRTR